MYIDIQIKYMPKKALLNICPKKHSKLLKIQFHIAKKLALAGKRDRRLQNTNDDDRTDKNLIARIAKFQNLIKTDNVYGTTLKSFICIGFVNFPVKFNMKFIFTLQAKIKKLFKTN